MRVCRYTLDMWEIKSVEVLSNAQPFERGLSIYERYMEEPYSSQNVALMSNDISYTY